MVPKADLFTDTVVVNTACEHRRLETEACDRARQREGWPAGHTDVPASRTVADAIRHLPGSKPRRAEGE